MKLKVKDSRGTVQSPEVAPSDTVATLKDKVADLFKIQEKPTIKLIFRGKLLQDDQLLSSYDLKEDSLVMVMQVKKTPEQLQEEKEIEDHKEQINQLEAAGYSREEVLGALRANNWDLIQAQETLEEEDSEGDPVNSPSTERPPIYDS
jgi:NACalpha-BTF3-like transcription factor